MSSERYEDEYGEPLTPAPRRNRHAPHVDDVDRWSGTVACDLAWRNGRVGRYWRVLERRDGVTRLEYIA